MPRRDNSPTQLAMNNLIFRPTKRSTSKPKPIPAASEVTTFDYVAGILKSKWDRMRKTR